MIRFPCFKCGKMLKAPEGTEGKPSRCKCGCDVIVPPSEAAFDFKPETPPMPAAATQIPAPLEPPQSTWRRSPEPLMTEELLERLARDGVKRPGAFARFVSIVGWAICGYCLLSAWGSLNGSYGNGRVGVADIAYAILVAITGYIIARIIEKIAYAIG